MKTAVETLKSRLRGTWIHHAVWAYKHPAPKTPSGNDSKQVSTDDRDANYNWQSIAVMFRVLRRNSNCIDVGAHVGDILQHMVAISPGGRHYAFEPLPHLSQKLAQTFPQVIVHQAAVGDTNGESEFLFVQNDPTFSGLRRRIYNRPDPNIATIRVHLVTLDEVIPRSEKVAFIKIDVEGGEFHVLKGGIETIRRGKPVIVFEANCISTGQYGVKADDVYLLLTGTLEYEVSTMERWLKRELPYTREEFENNWNRGPEFYFIATPAKKGKKK